MTKSLTGMRNTFIQRANSIIAQPQSLTLAQVNKALKKAGIEDKLFKGNGYFYFVGEKADGWMDNSVHVNSLDALHPSKGQGQDCWVYEYHRLEKENDPAEQDRANEERYGKKRK